MNTIDLRKRFLTFLALWIAGFLVTQGLVFSKVIQPAAGAACDGIVIVVALAITAVIYRKRS